MAITAPAPRPPHRLWRRESRWMTISRHPGSSPVLSRDLPVRPTRDSPFRPMHLPAVSPADLRSVLGPRSLAPAALFGARLTSLFETRRRLPTSATAFTTCGQRTRALGSSQGRRPRPPSFSYVPRALPCGSGDTRRAALRPPTSAPVPVPPACAGLPDRDAETNAAPPDVLRREHSAD